MRTTYIFLIFSLFISCQIDHEPVVEITTNKGEELESLLNGEEYFSDIPVTTGLAGRTNWRDDEAALGRIIFYDKNLSFNQKISCGSCHIQEFGFSDPKPLSIGIFNSESTRNAMSLSHAGYRSRFFWDQSEFSLSTATLKPFLNSKEMGLQDLDQLEGIMEDLGYYKNLFQEVYQTDNISHHAIGRALSNFISSIYSFNSEFDHNEATDYKDASELVNEGFRLFNSKALCSRCHGTYNLNGWNSENIGLDSLSLDEGEEAGKFTVPSLRNIELTAPYMHDGRFATLDDVIEHYTENIIFSENLSNKLKNSDQTAAVDIDLSDYEKEALKAFLLTLTDNEISTDEKYSDPF